MKVSIQEIGRDEEEEILIKCHEMNEEVLTLLYKIKRTQESLIGTIGEEIYKLYLKDIFYFETVDNKSFLYCENQVYETKMKLYEFQAASEGSRFFRASKSSVVNAMKISHIKPSLGSRFEVSLENGERIMVSRQYVPDLKRQLGMEA